MSSSILGDIEVAESNVDSSSSNAIFSNSGSYFKPMSHYRVLQLPRWLRRLTPKWDGIDWLRLLGAIAGIAFLLFVAAGILFVILTPKPKSEVVKKLESLESSLDQGLSDLARQINSSSQGQSKAIVEGMKRVVSGLKTVDGGLTSLGSGLVHSYQQLNTSLTRLSDSMTQMFVEENAKLAVKLDQHYNLTASVEEEKKQLISDLSHTLWPTTPSASQRSEVVEEVLEQLEEGIALEAKVINASTPVGQMWTFGEGGVLKSGDGYCLEEVLYDTLHGKPCHGHMTGYQQWRYDHEKQQLTHPRYYAPALKHGDPVNKGYWGCLSLDRHDLESVDLVSCDEESLFQRWLLVDSMYIDPNQPPIEDYVW